MEDGDPQITHTLVEEGTAAMRRPAARTRERRAGVEPNLPAELGDALGFRLRRATTISDALFGEFFGPLEINPAQYATLMVVRHNPGCQTSAAGTMLGITPNNLVPLLDSLVARGFIRRTLSSTDRRVRNLRLTPAGVALCEQLDAAHAGLQAKVEGHMGQENAAELLRLLTLYCA